MWKRIVVVILLLLLCLSADVKAIENNIVDIDAIESLDNTIKSIAESINDDSGDLDIYGLYKSILEGDIEIDGKKIMTTIGGLLVGDINSLLGLLGQLLFLGVIAALINSIQTSFGDGEIGRIGQWVVYLIFMSISLKSINMAMDMGLSGIKHMTDFLYGSLPILLSILAVLGGATGIAIVKPILLVILTITMHTIDAILVPLLYLLAVVVIVGQLMPDFSLSKLTKLIKNIIMIILGFMMTVFTGILGVSSVASASIDGITMRTIKYGVSNFIPVVGNHIAAAMDTLLGTSLLLKNGIGVFGLIFILILTILPAVKILLMALLYNVAGAVLEPLGVTSYSNALDSIGGVLMTLFALVAITGMLFFFLLFFLISMSNITMMFR